MINSTLVIYFLSHSLKSMQPLNRHDSCGPKMRRRNSHITWQTFPSCWWSAGKTSTAGNTACGSVHPLDPNKTASSMWWCWWLERNLNRVTPEERLMVRDHTRENELGASIIELSISRGIQTDQMGYPLWVWGGTRFPVEDSVLKWFTLCYEVAPSPGYK